jgi:hypothetical protein
MVRWYRVQMEWKFNQRHGWGVAKTHGDVYDGMYSEDKRHRRVRSTL